MTWHSSWLSDTIVTYKLGSESGCGVIHETVSVSMSELPGRSPSDGAPTLVHDEKVRNILSPDTTLPG